jgi:predicted lysophospholipase L1 biosynthesis ABC-type transport system permease subunit
MTRPSDYTDRVSRPSKFFPTLLLGIFFMFLIMACVILITDDAAERAQLTASIALGLAIGTLLRQNKE